MSRANKYRHSQPVKVFSSTSTSGSVNSARPLRLLRIAHSLIPQACASCLDVMFRLNISSSKLGYIFSAPFLA
nr:MAG TPA: hypothetical protein [Caudoviricetes sp.]